MKTGIRNPQLLRNPSIDTVDVDRAEHIFGPASALLKGRATRKKASSTKIMSRLTVPTIILEHYEDVVLAMDFFGVNGIIFLHTKSKI